MKKLLILTIFFGSLAIFSQSENNELRVFSFSEAEKLQQQNSKPILVFIYTDWCKICHGMKKTTFKDKVVIQLLNDHFYFVQLNGEEKENITFLGKTFAYKPTGTTTGIHELANQLASKKGRIAYPTTTILNSKFEINLQSIGYIKTKKMTSILSKTLKLSKNN